MTALTLSTGDSKLKFLWILSTQWRGMRTNVHWPSCVDKCLRFQQQIYDVRVELPLQLAYKPELIN